MLRQGPYYEASIALLNLSAHYWQQTPPHRPCAPPRSPCSSSFATSSNRFNTTEEGRKGEEALSSRARDEPANDASSSAHRGKQASSSRGRSATQVVKDKLGVHLEGNVFYYTRRSICRQC
jgi:hypothetical protein